MEKGKDKGKCSSKFRNSIMTLRHICKLASIPVWVLEISLDLAVEGSTSVKYLHRSVREAGL